MRATLGTHKDFGQTCGACQVNCARRVSIRCIALAGTSVGWSSVILFFFLPPSCVPWLHARYALLRYYGRSDSRTPDIGCLKMYASPEVQPPGLQSTGLRRCPCLKKADRFGSAPSRTSECANRPQITEKSTGLCQEFWSLSARQPIRFPPFLCGSITTRRKQAVPHGQIDGPFDVELVAARLERTFEDRSQFQGSPQAAKDQIRTDPLHLHWFGLAGGMRIDDRQFLAEAKT